MGDVQEAGAAEGVVFRLANGDLMGCSTAPREFMGAYRKPLQRWNMGLRMQGLPGERPFRGMAAVDRFSGKRMDCGIATFVGGEGQTGSIETTALAAFALLRGGEQPELANAALQWLGLAIAGCE